MFWLISFIILLAITVVPFPFKIYGYLSGKDDSPMIVKFEEMTNALFMSVGLFGFYGFISDRVYLTPLFWNGWLCVAIVWSLLPLFWSPKLDYATEMLGCYKMRLLAGVSSILYLPLLFAVYFYAN
ncbi:hypothetical protein [Pseudoalteromonas sp. PA2MD11]|uniref:hypothetical protein n=1 Tax=Pseudoalteromonas sp. PA2MD11 TaxID=2785057 RepID=UPI001ADFCB56|nr:hypothetical protein [Pseudoalteromonas sp. PA2MD11]